MLMGYRSFWNENNGVYEVATIFGDLARIGEKFVALQERSCVPQPGANPWQDLTKTRRANSVENLRTRMPA